MRIPWQLLALTAPLFFVAYQALSKLLPKGTSIFLVNAYASLAGAAVMIVLHLALSQNKSFSLEAKTLGLSLAIGTLIAFGNFAIIKAFSFGAPQSVFSAMYNSAYIVFALIVGVLVWRERIATIQGAGVVLIIGGIVLVTNF
jgi:drug/metabolite transporter (DMT)-like permease